MVHPDQRRSRRIASNPSTGLSGCRCRFRPLTGGATVTLPDQEKAPTEPKGDRAGHQEERVHPADEGKWAASRIWSSVPPRPEPGMWEIACSVWRRDRGGDLVAVRSRPGAGQLFGQEIPDPALEDRPQPGNAAQCRPAGRSS